MNRPTAQSQNLVACEMCGQLSRAPKEENATITCPTCGAKLESRKSNNLSRTWALVIAGFILYIPANVYPVMTFATLGDGEPDTIMTGVVELFQSGMWAIGLLVLCASILVPLMKLIGLSYLLITIQRAQGANTRDRTKLYRIIELIGRWSMLDVFLVSILIAVVDLGMVASITPDIGAAFFASVVVVTMFAANSFDPRVLWDRAEKHSHG